MYYDAISSKVFSGHPKKYLNYEAKSFFCIKSIISGIVDSIPRPPIRWELIAAAAVAIFADSLNVKLARSLGEETSPGSLVKNCCYLYLFWEPMWMSIFY